MKLHSNIIGEGTPVLILHGFLGMGDNWKTFAKQMSQKNYECHLIDQRNHGRSDHSDKFSYDLMAEDLWEYCQEKKLDKIILLGHSMGGKTVMRFACSHPEIVEDLIVVDIAPKAYEPHHQTILEGLNDLAQRDLDSRGKADERLSNYIKEWGVRQFLLKNLYWKDKGKLAFRMNLPVLSESMEKLGEGLNDEEIFKGGTLFIRGKNSDYITDEDRDLIRKHFPKSQLITIEDAGHWVHAEQRDVFFETVAGFLDRG